MRKVFIQKSKRIKARKVANRDQIYFASDLHLGAPDPQKSLIREKHFVRWLDEIEPNVAELYLLGDVFDFWFEYKRAVPKGFVRILGKLAELSDQGVKIHLFSGNHDLWYSDYLESEIHAQIYKEPVIKEIFGKKFYLAHGDGLGPGDHGYKIMKRIVVHPISKWLFARLHPNFGIGLAHLFSRMGGDHNYQNPEDVEVRHKGQDEYLYSHSKKILQEHPDIDFFIYGHRHVLIDDEFAPDTRIIILGDWIQYFSYLVVNEEEVQLKVYSNQIWTPQADPS